ncbi:hypothetical protein FKW77_009597 [Venturia effusa]|uniref:Uncharacterized protein n=1 Tax=Venturia effusa TaxID=50376 RepID=A0A517L059_9PEZI|nr:hypothetical protein FKW77_009597 [Venturia effusa]
MPYLHAMELAEPLNPYIFSLDLVLRSIYTILSFDTSNNNSNIHPPNQAVIRQRLQVDKQGLEILIDHLSVYNAPIIGIYAAYLFVNDLHVVRNALGILLLEGEGMGMPGFQFRMEDVVQNTKRKVGEMLGFE